MAVDRDSFRTVQVMEVPQEQQALLKEAEERDGASNRSQIIQDQILKFIHDGASNRSESNRALHNMREKFEANEWRSLRNDRAFQAAEASGFLKKLLCLFPLPLHRYPDCSEDMCRDARQWIEQVKENMVEDLVELPTEKPHLFPTPEACVLANFLWVPGPATEMLIEEMLEEMVVFSSAEVKPVVSPLEATGAQDIGAVFLKRVAGEEDIRVGVEQDEIEHRIDKKEFVYKGHVYKTTEIFNFKRACDGTYTAIPVQATRAAFIIPGPDPMADGGFMYLTDEDDDGQKIDPPKLLAVNKISLKRGRTALHFDKPVPLEPSSGNTLRSKADREDQLFDIRFQFLLKQGYKGTWVDPTRVKELNYIEVAASTPKSHRLSQVKNVRLSQVFDRASKVLEAEHGGFAFLSEDSNEKVSWFYPIKVAAQVVNRGSLSASKLNVGLFDEDAKGKEIAEALLNDTWDYESAERWSCSSLLQPKSESVPVKVWRLGVPGVLHPRVLHALSLSTREEMLKTPFARAIANKGYAEAPWYKFYQLVTQAITMFCLQWFACFARDLETRKQDGDQQIWIDRINMDHNVQRMIAALLLLVMWSIQVIVNVCLWLQYRKVLGKRSFFSKFRMLDLFCLALQLPLILVMMPVTLSQQDIAKEDASVYRGYLPMSTELMVLTNTRPFIAFVGAWLWIRWLWLLCTVETLNLGRRILPIQQTLGEIAPFLIVMLFFIMTAMTVSYAITNELASTLILKMYSMAFAGEYPEEVFFHLSSGSKGSEGKGDGEEQDIKDTGVQWGLRFVLYSGFGIVIMVALNNIFIAILGETYNRFQKKAECSFVQRRAFVALDYQLLHRANCCGRRANRGGQDMKTYLWFCTPVDDREEADDSAVHSKVDQVDTRIKKLEKTIEKVQSQVERMAEQQSGHIHKHEDGLAKLHKLDTLTDLKDHHVKLTEQLTTLKDTHDTIKGLRDKGDGKSKSPMWR